MDNAAKVTDYNPIAIGFIQNLDNSELALLAFGMIPKDKFDPLMDTIFQVFSEKVTAPGERYDGLEPDEVRLMFTKEWKNEIERKMSVAIYQNARMVV